MNHITIFLIICCFALPHAHGQKEKAKKSVKVQFKVTRFDSLDRPSPEFLAGTATTQTKVKVPKTHILGPFETTLRDGVYLDFWRGQSEKPEISIKIGAEERKGLLLIFVPRKTSFVILKVLLQNKILKGGSRYIVNATQEDLVIQTPGLQPLLIKTKKAGVLSAPKNKNISPIVIRQRRKTGWELVSTENWAFDRRFRKILFIYRTSKSQGLLFHEVEERL